MALSSCSKSIRIIRPALRLARFLNMLFNLMTLSLCLISVGVNVLVLIGTVQMVSTAYLNFCQIVVNRHTIINSHCASSSSELLDTLFVPIKIIIPGILPGVISSTIRYSCAFVAPPKAVTVVIHEVLKFCITLTKLSPSIKCDVPSGGCCMFTGGIHVDRLNHARISVTGTSVKWFFTWLFLCISNTRGTLFSSALPLSSCLRLLRSSLVSLWCQLPFSSSFPGRALPCVYLGSFHRVQSPRNLAHSCGLRVVQLLLSASAYSARRLDHLGCHWDPGWSLSRLLSELVHLSFGLGLKMDLNPFFRKNNMHYNSFEIHYNG